MATTNRKTAQSEETRRELIAAARSLFAERGYADTPLEDIVQQAGVTRGAVYHHFRDKEDLFREVHDQVHAEMDERVVAAVMAAPDPWRSLLDGCQAFLDGCLDPAVQRIVLLDASAVLGSEHSHEDHDRKDLDMVTAGLQNAMEQGLVARQPAEPLAHLLLGAIKEASAVIAGASDQRAARRDMGAAVERILSGLLVRRHED